MLSCTSLSKNFFRYIERDEQQRADYQERLSKIDKKRIVYLAESGFQSELNQEKCWSKIGHPLFGERSGKRKKRINLFCGLNSKFQPIAPYLTEENCNAASFEG